MSAIGQQDGKKFTLTSLADLGRHLEVLMSERIGVLETTIASIQAKKSDGEEGINLAHLYEECLLRHTEDFPRARLLNTFRKKTWSGNNDLVESLGDYDQALRSLRAAEREIDLLIDAASEVKKMRMFTKLLGTRCCEIFNHARDCCAEEFEPVTNRLEVSVDILSDRESIERVIVDPLLIQVREQDVECLDFMSRRALTEWASGSKSQLMSAWDFLGNAVEALKRIDLDGRVSLPSLEQLVQFPGLNALFESVTKDLILSVTQTIESTLSAQLAALNIWDLLRIRVSEQTAKTGEDPRAILEKFFSFCAQKAKCFGKISVQSSRETCRQSMHFVGVREDADRCFQALGIAEPDYLARLMERTFGQSSSMLAPGTDWGRSDFSVFVLRQGELPTSLVEFQDVKQLLASTQADDVPSLDWSDRRFPQWIREWWGQSEKPDYLRS
jgi:hypothetical protein